jgi:hypothetical protein
MLQLVVLWCGSLLVSFQTFLPQVIFWPLCCSVFVLRIAVSFFLAK